MAESITVHITDTAADMLRRVGKRFGKNTYQTLRDLILHLETDPQIKGEGLSGPLHGLHSLQYARFRVIYRIDRGRLIVLVVGAGFHESGDRDDIYQVIKRLVDTGRIEIRGEERK